MGARRRHRPLSGLDLEAFVQAGEPQNPADDVRRPAEDEVDVRPGLPLGRDDRPQERAVDELHLADVEDDPAVTSAAATRTARSSSDATRSSGGCVRGAQRSPPARSGQEGRLRSHPVRSRPQPGRRPVRREPRAPRPHRGGTPASKTVAPQSFPRPLPLRSMVPLSCSVCATPTCGENATQGGSRGPIPG